jgi:DNA-binding transcriptional LysR family regulator
MNTPAVGAALADADSRHSILCSCSFAVKGAAIGRRLGGDWAAIAGRSLGCALGHEDVLAQHLDPARGVADHAQRMPALESLRADAFVLYGPPGAGLYNETVRACAKAGFVPTIGQHAPRITSTLCFVAVGMGVALVPSSMRHVAVEGGTELSAKRRHVVTTSDGAQTKEREVARYWHSAPA